MKYVQTRYEIYVTVYTEFDDDGNPIIESGEKSRLDTFDYEMISFDMSVNEIQDISNRNSTYSKTIKLPDTDNNRRLFGFICNLDVESTLFKPNKRSDCEIYVDTILIYKGTLQLKKVVCDYSTNDIYYEAVFFSNVLDFYKNVGEKYLTDLSSLSRYNHDYTYDNIVHSWTQSYSNGYYYPLIDYGRKYIYEEGKNNNSQNENPWGFSILNMSGTYSVEVQQFYPAIYAKQILDQIFIDAGYQYDSNFLNSERFINLIIPFMNKFLKSDTQNTNLPQIEDLSGNLYTTDVIGKQTISSIPRIYFADVNFVGGIQYGTQSSATFSNITVYNSTEDSVATIYRQILCRTNVGYFENTSSKSIYYRPSVNLTLDALGFINGSMNKMINSGSIYAGGTTFIQVYGLDICWAVQRSGSTASTEVARVRLYDFTSNGSVDTTTYRTNGFADGWLKEPVQESLLNDTGYLQLDPGDKTFIYFSFNNESGNNSIFNLPNRLFSISGQIKHNLGDILSEGGLVNVPLNLPQNVKQKDFLTNIIKLFNLYVEPDKVYPKILRIEPRDDYYNYDKLTGEQVILDWSKKVDISQPIDIDILSETQNKTIKYTYKEDKDYFNGLYKVNTNRISGDAIKEVDNDFNTGEKKVEVIFGPSVLANIPGYGNFPVVNMAKQISDVTGYPVGSTDTNMRILYRKYVDLFGDTWNFKSQSMTNGMTFSSYPYAGNFDDPFFSTQDLSFNQPLVNFYYNPNFVEDNLFKTYYENQFKEIIDEKSRMLTCEMYLTPNDINNLYFNYIIYLELGGVGSYWRINSIKNYDITGRSTCTVELIKALYPQVKVPYISQYVTTTTTSTTTTTTTAAPPSSASIYAYATYGDDPSKIQVIFTVAEGTVADGLTFSGRVQSYSDFCTTFLSNCDFTNAAYIPPGATAGSTFSTGDLCSIGAALSLNVYRLEVNGTNIISNPDTYTTVNGIYTIYNRGTCYILP